MSKSNEAFLAEMILRLVPFGAKIGNDVGEQLDRSTPFTREDVERLYAIKHATPTAQEGEQNG